MEGEDREFLIVDKPLDIVNKQPFDEDSEEEVENEGSEEEVENEDSGKPTDDFYVCRCSETLIQGMVGIFVVQLVTLGFLIFT